MTASSTFLEIYLDDHWAAAGAGVRLARRLARHHAGTSWDDRLHRLAAEVAADDRTLSEIRRALDVDGGGIKRRLAALGETAGRFKLNGRIIRPSPLSPLVECEFLIAGITGKLRLWTSLQAALAGDDRLSAYDLEELRLRAAEQLTVLDELHTETAREAFRS